MTSRILLDTRDPFDAGLLGLDGTRDPSTTDEGVIVEFHPGTPTVRPSIDIVVGGGAEINIYSKSAIREVGKALLAAVDIINHSEKARGHGE
jgi:hypothetical protein